MEFAKDNERYRRIGFVLYPDSEIYNCDEILTNLQVAFVNDDKTQCAWILHDKDVYESTGELKKPHYHVGIKFTNPRYLRNVRKLIGLIDEIKVLEIEDWGLYVLYLLHYENDSNAMETDI